MTNQILFTKKDIMDEVSYEVQQARNRKQHMLWVYWHHNTRKVCYLDTFQEFKQLETLYEVQGFAKDQLASKPTSLNQELIKVKAKEMKMHVYRNMEAEEEIPMDPVSLLLAGRMNGSGEFVIVQIKCC